MGFFTNFKRDRRRRKSWDEAYALIHTGKFAEAARIYEQMAAESLEYNELIYEGDCHDAFKVWLKAGNADNALTNARDALRVISNSDWIRLSEGTVDDFCKMVGEFYGAGFEPAADVFANEINAELVKHKLPPRFETRHGKFPSACPQCGGTLPFTYSDVSVTCPFCNSVFRAE
jgi:tetratricopeptide (TPR) repeat protein